MHDQSSRLWAKKTWEFPLLHNFTFTFGLSLENTAKASTIVPAFFQDNALIDYELIKTNPLNADFAIDVTPNTMKGSIISHISFKWTAFIPDANTEIEILKFNTMPIHTAMLNRLDAFDQKTGTDIEALIEMQHETTDEQAYPIYNNTKLFESQGARDLSISVPGLTTDGQLEGVVFDKDTFFDAKRYYTNRAMLNQVTGNMRTHQIVEPLSPHGRAIINGGLPSNTPGIVKHQNPYTYYGLLFHLPQADSLFQFHDSDTITDIEAVTVKGACFFAEHNDDFNFAVS